MSAGKGAHHFKCRREGDSRPRHIHKQHRVKYGSKCMCSCTEERRQVDYNEIATLAQGDNAVAASSNKGNMEGELPHPSQESLQVPAKVTEGE